MKVEEGKVIGQCGSRISKTWKLMGYGDNREGRSKGDLQGIIWSISQKR